MESQPAAGVQTDALLKRADDDATTLQFPGVPEIPFWQPVQAAVEKLLKALLNERRGTFQRVHDQPGNNPAPGSAGVH